MKSMGELGSISFIDFSVAIENASNNQKTI
jgi:hypothetical protein